MMKKERAMSLSFSMTAKTIENIESISKKYDLDRSKLMTIVINYLKKNPNEMEKILEIFLT